MLALLLCPSGAWAQMTSTLVANDDGSGDLLNFFNRVYFAQSFVAATGFTLSSVEIHFDDLTTDAAFTVTVHRPHADNAANPGTKVADLTLSGTLSTTTANVFNAPANTDLVAGTYFVQVRRTAGSATQNLLAEGTDAESSGSRTGWSIADSVRYSGNGSSWTTWGAPFRFAIKGTVVVDTTAPTVTSFVRHNPMSKLTNADSLTWRVTFSEDVKNVDAADFGVRNFFAAVTATITVARVTGSSSVYDVTAFGGDLVELNDEVDLGIVLGHGIADTADNALMMPGPTGANESYDLDNTPPAFSTAEVRGTSLVLTFDEDLAPAVNLTNTAFTVKKTPSALTETTVSLSGTPAISGATVTLTLSAAVVATDTGVKVRYTQPTTGTDNRLRDEAGNEVVTFSGTTGDTPPTSPTGAPTSSAPG